MDKKLHSHKKCDMIIHLGINFNGGFSAPVVL